MNGESEMFFKEQTIWWISIPPYSPQSNPTERLIALINYKGWKHWMRIWNLEMTEDWMINKPLSLGLVKRIVDDVSQENIAKTWLNRSGRNAWRKLKLSNCFYRIRQFNITVNFSNNEFLRKFECMVVFSIFLNIQLFHFLNFSKTSEYLLLQVKRLF